MADRVKITAKMYGWSKYGGARHGLVKEDLEEWYCQSCGDKQTRALPNYMFDYDGDMRDFIRVCSKCKHECVKKKIKKVTELIKDQRKKFLEDQWGTAEAFENLDEL